MRRKRQARKPTHGPVGGGVSSWAWTDVGKKREKNEDNFLVDPSLMLYMVADGMGGHAGGETASRMAVETVHEVIKSARRNGDVFPHEAGKGEHKPVMELMERAIREASSRIFNASSRKPELNGMGTTSTMTMFLGERCYVAHVGDSRLYRLRDGAFEQITEDHSLVAEQVKAGFITEEEAQFSRFRNIITRSVGFESQVQPDTFSLALKEGDVFLICSDGLTGMVTDPDIKRVLQTSPLRQAAVELVNMANLHGGDDNVTLVLLRYKGGEGKAAARQHKRTSHKRKKHRS